MTNTVRIPQRFKQALARYCIETQRSKSEVIIELLQNHFTVEVPVKTPYELACETGFLGSLSLDENAAENSQHTVCTAIASQY